MTTVIVSVLIILFVYVWSISFWASRYRKVPPDQMMIIYGRKNRHPVTGKEIFYRILKGGGTFVWPFIEVYKIHSLDIMSINIQNLEVQSKSDTALLMNGSALIMYEDSDDALYKAVEYFLDKSPGQVEENLRDILGNHLKLCCKELSWEEIISGRNNLVKQVVESSCNDLTGIGMKLFLFNLKKIENTLLSEVKK